MSWLVLGAGVLTIAVTAHMVLVSYSTLPYWDTWDQIIFAAQHGPAHTFEWLWRQFNQHRVLIPRLLELADLRWFHATQVSLLACIFAIQCFHLALLGWCMRVLGGFDAARWRTGFGLAAFCLFCPSQWANFLMGFQVCFVLPPMLATLSFAGLLLYWRGRNAGANRARWSCLAVSIGAASAAAYTLANGNLVWPVLIAAALLLRLDLPAIVALAVSGTVSTAAFLWSYAAPAGASSAASAPLGLLKYLAVYLGSSWAPTHTTFLAQQMNRPAVPIDIRMAEMLGLGGLGLSFALLLRLPSLIRANRAFAVQVLLILLFCVLTGAITAVGRLGFGVAQAFSSRYQTVALLFWCSIALLLIDFRPRRGAKLALILFETAVLAAMSLAAYLSPEPLTVARLQGFHVNAAAMALVTGVADVDELRWAHDNPDLPLSLVPYMRQQRLSVFAGDRPSLLGKSLSTAFLVSPSGACLGAVESVKPIAEGWPGPVRITGWAVRADDLRPPSAIVTVADGVITGLGAIGDWRSSGVSSPPAATPFIGYTAYISAARRSSQITVYGIVHDSACAIAAFTPE